MDVSLALVVYLGLGLAHWLWGSPARDLKNIVTEIERDKNESKYSGTQFQLRLLLLRFTVFVASLSLYPLFYCIKIYDFFFFRPQKRTAQVEMAKYDDDKLYFWSTGGVGSLWCEDCGHAEEILSFIHGSDSCTSGVQCQECGRFASYHSNDDEERRLICRCGGKLSRDDALFCSTCKSTALKFSLRLIT